MKRAAWILAIVFGLAFLGATLTNVDLILKSRAALAGGTFREGGAASAARYQVVAVMPDTDDSFFRGLLEGIDEGARAADAAVQVFRYPVSASGEAERYFDIALRAKADGLVMYTPRDDRAAGRAERAAANGVAFVPVGTDAPPSNPRGFIGSGSLLQGLEGGKLVCASLGSAARIGVILPSTGSGEASDEPLYVGVAAAIRSYPGASITAAVRARPGILAGEEAAEAMLRAHPSVNALLCSSSRDTIGAAQVVVDTNKVGSVLIVGADMTPEIARYIDKGVVTASIVRDSKWMGGEAMRQFARRKAGQAEAGAVGPSFAVRTRKGGQP